MRSFRLFSRWLPALRRQPQATGPFSTLRVALVADELTRSCLLPECQVLDVTPQNAASVLRHKRPDLVFVESAWSGRRNRWKFRIAAYPDHPERTNADLRHLVTLARELHIPTVFWNKEDGVHFERFIDSARLFDAIFTVDASCVERYKAHVGPDVPVGVLPFAVQPVIHSFSGIDPNRKGACFVGSYSQHIHDARRERQDMLLQTAGAVLGLTVYDRNSDRRADRYRYPGFPGLHVKPRVPHHDTAHIYKSHLVSLNVNTVENSDTMFSRRLIEILACGGLAVSTPALALDRLFPGFCHVVRDKDEASALFGRLARDGYHGVDLDMMAAGAAHVAAHHTWAQRLATIMDAAQHARR